MKDLTGLIISNRPDEVKTLSRAKSVPFLSNVLYHEPIGYNPIKKEPIAKLNPRSITYNNLFVPIIFIIFIGIFKSMTKQNFEMLNIKRTNFLKKKELEEQINQNKLEFDQKIKNIAVKKFKSYQLEEKEKKMNMELINMAKSLDYKTLIKNNEEIKNTFSYLRNKIEMKDNKPGNIIINNNYFLKSL